MIDRLWMRMTEIYGLRFTSSYGASPSETWAKGLAGMTGQQIAIGLSRCISGDHAWPPTLPEFKALCMPRPEDLGIPPLEDAWREAVGIACQTISRERCSHAVVWHAYCEAGPIGHMQEDKGRKVFEHAYRQAVAMALRGEPLQPIPKALPRPAPAASEATPEQRQQAMAEAMARLESMGLVRRHE